MRFEAKKLSSGQVRIVGSSSRRGWLVLENETTWCEFHHEIWEVAFHVHVQGCFSDFIFVGLYFVVRIYKDNVSVKLIYEMKTVE